MKKLNNHVFLVVILALLASIRPMGIDTYIPSIPDIATSFKVSIERVEFSISIFLVGLSIGQIFGGVISDKYGRKKSSIYGLYGFSLFSFLIIFSESIYEMWIYRFFESFFGGIVLVNTAAIVRDRFNSNEAAKVYSVIGMVRSIAPLIAPAIGAIIISFFSWKAVFVFLTIYPLVIIYFVYLNLDESFTYVKQNIFDSFLLVLSNKNAMKAMVVLGFSFSGLFIFITKSSFIYIEYFKISTNYFPFFFSINFIALMFLTRFNIFLLKNSSVLSIMKIALIVQSIFTIAFLINYEDITLVKISIFFIVYIGFMAFLFGNSLALAMEHFPNNAGVASSVSGVLQFGFAALISSFVLKFHNQGFLSIALSLMLLSICSYLILRTYSK